MDFTKPKSLGQDIDADYEQLTNCGGYDHNYCIDNPNIKTPFATIHSPKSGIKLTSYTDLPGVQLYTGNKLGTGDDEKGGKYAKRAGVCLETQFYPDTPNNPNFPQNIFAPREVFSSRTIYQVELV